MKNIFRFLSHYLWAVALVVILLVAQAYFDLSLPNYTSDLLNISLQQGGIADAVPDTIRSDALEELKLFLPDADSDALDSAYARPDGSGVRALSPDADREALAQLMAVPECMVLQMQTHSDSGMDLTQIRAAIDGGMMTKEQLLRQMAEPMQQLSALSDTYVKQIAVRYVTAEYEAQGVDLNAVRNDYLWAMGGKMVLMSLLMMLTAIAVGFIASRVSAGVGRDLREQMYDRILAFSSAEMERFSTASLITRATNDIQQIQMVSVLLLRMVLYAPILAGLEFFVPRLSEGGVILLHDEEDAYRFFEDLCTIPEIKSISQRLEVAELLRKKETYQKIAEETGASSATISRVNRALTYGADGYNRVFDEMEKE